MINIMSLKSEPEAASAVRNSQVFGMRMSIQARDHITSLKSQSRDRRSAAEEYLAEPVSPLPAALLRMLSQN